MRQSKEARKARRLRHIALGLCIECSNKSLDGKQLCKEHNEKRKERDRRRYRIEVSDKRSRGVCVYRGCNCEAMPGESYCGYHQEMTAEKQSSFQAKNVAAGKCRCGRELKQGISRNNQPYKTCESCYQSRDRYSKSYREARRQARLAAMEANSGLLE